MDEPAVAQVDADVRELFLVLEEQKVAFRGLRERDLARRAELRLRDARHGKAVRSGGLAASAGHRRP